ncbi:MAG: methyltransferase domain-containing protein [Burkholderiales bacterium]|nr:methyltransferase domain-containing protein [Burkholderiales bacterium]
MKKLLHIGCGTDTIKDLAVSRFADEGWHEVRFDINPGVKPDIVGDMVDMNAVETGSMDAVYSAHNIEHVFPHQVLPVLKEFHRVLAPGGFLVITCPDIQTVAEHVAAGRLMEPLYVSPAGPISALDILYGHASYIGQGKTYMAHKCGFIYKVLADSLYEAGFGKVFGGRRPEAFDLWALATKEPIDDDAISALAERYLPQD